MNRILSIDPSGTGITGIYFRHGQQEEFNSYKDKDWQKHYHFIVSLIKLYQPNILLYESTNYVSLRGKDMTSLFKLLGALAVLPVEQIKSVPVNQVKELKGKLLKGTKQIPGLKFAKGRGKGWSLNKQKISVHELDAYLVYWLGKEKYWEPELLEDIDFCLPGEETKEHECERECPTSPCVKCGQYWRGGWED